MDDEIHNETLDKLDTRIKKLEEKIIGKDYDRIVQQKEDVISTLASLGSKLGNALSTRDRMMMVMKRMDELERYLNPTYGEPSDLHDDVKMDLVVAQEDKLHTQYEQLNKLSSMKKCLDSQSIADTLSSLNDDLIHHWHTHDETSKRANDHIQNTSDTVENYNAIILNLTQAFIRMDEVVTKAELAAEPRKVLE